MALKARHRGGTSLLCHEAGERTTVGIDSTKALYVGAVTGYTGAWVEMCRRRGELGRRRTRKERAKHHGVELVDHRL
jgi:hypothetical protein